MWKIIYLTLIVHINCSVISLNGQVVNVAWTEHLGSQFNDQLQDLTVDLNGDIIAVGQIPNNGNKIMLAKFTPDGDLIYNKTIGTGSSSFAPGRIKVSPRNTYIISGLAGTIATFFLELDISGEPINFYAGQSFNIHDFAILPSGYLAIGKATDPLLIFFDSTMNVLSTISLKGQNGTITNLTAITPSGDGNYLILGKDNSGAAVVKVSESGQILWERLYEGNMSINIKPVSNTGPITHASGIAAYESGAFIFGVSSIPPGLGNTFHFQIFSCSKEGSVLWSNYYMPVPNLRSWLSGVFIQKNGSIIAFGKAESAATLPCGDDSRDKAVAIGINPVTGEMTWDLCVGGESHDHLAGLFCSDNETCFACGPWANGPLGQTDGFIARFNIETISSSDVNNHIKEQKINLYPNPAQSELLVSEEIPHADIYLLDILGKVNKVAVNGQRLDISNLPSGQYIVLLYQNMDLIFRDKVLIIN